MLGIHRAVLLVPFLLLAALPAPATPGPQAAATLLLPYFEVDLAAGADGQTTLFSVNNAGDHAVVAHVVTWTDWGIPTHSFDVVLGPDDVQTINLRDLFVAGIVPATNGILVEGCEGGVHAPPLELEALRRAHGGRPDAEDGLCRGSGRLGEDVVTGYVTVDTLRTCVGGVPFYPGDDGYFSSDFGGVPPEPLAIGDNVLWGDVFHLAAADDSAQGSELVHVPFDPDAEAGETFYRLFEPEGADGRALLGSRYRGRFLRGGAFDGGTDLLVWLENGSPPGPAACGSRGELVHPCHEARFDVFDEEGLYTGGASRPPVEVAFRLPVGGGELLASPAFGFVELSYFDLVTCGTLPPPRTEPLQAWLIPVMKAQDRFSVGLTATRLEPLP